MNFFFCKFGSSHLAKLDRRVDGTIDRLVQWDNPGYKYVMELRYTELGGTLGILMPLNLSMPMSTWSNRLYMAMTTTLTLQWVWGNVCYVWGHVTHSAKVGPDCTFYGYWMISLAIIFKHFMYNQTKWDWISHDEPHGCSHCFWVDLIKRSEPMDPWQL